MSMMSPRFPRLAAALAMIGMVSVPAAQAACFDQATAQAARINEFETMMMVVSLHCSRIGVAMKDDFEAMRRAHEAPFGQAAMRLRRYLGGQDEDLHSGQYDRFLTLTANRYGGGATRVDDCQILDTVVIELAHNPDMAMLSAVAGAMVARPLFDGFACSSEH